MFLSSFRDDVDLIVCVGGTEVWHFSDLGQSCAIPDACMQELVLGQAHTYFKGGPENFFKHITA